MSEPTSRWTIPWRLLHCFIICLFAFQVLYSVHQVFVVLTPDGQLGALGARSAGLTFEQMIPRRLYAIEGWIAGGALIIYLAIVEIGPRRGR